MFPRVPAGPIPRLVSLSTAVPAFDVSQREVSERAVGAFAATPNAAAWLEPIYRNAEIETRHACMTPEWYVGEHGFGERNDLFLEHAVELLTRAARSALDAARLRPGDIDVIVTICSTGIATPALDARLMEKLAFRRDVERLPVFGLGCAGGVLGLARAAAMAQARPDARVLLLVVELCSLTFRLQDRSKSNLVATALFGDGAAAAVVSCREEYAAKPRLGPWGEHTWPGSLDVMGWDVADDGLKVVFSRDIPTLVRDELRPVIDAFLTRHDAGLGDLAGFVCHPGGAKVLDALEDCFETPRGSLVHARQVLRDHGNMSAATVLFVLKEALEAGARGPQLMTTLGPGFTAGMLVVEAA
ncbi:MAG TPA: 3-oxoacyl-[acyl-carrier-protein] synthase III C-terminal domain-containing protein [Caulobacteraceae bacterium]|jgi:alkylresorcinol/alkylpyrone synthase|nr:3-oxoacyl-[acyl-carrier-protein] synthase III C-terminal domain-containing protein [Caulobacteraceae bacterium]